MLGKAWGGGKGKQSFALLQDALGLAVTWAYVGISAGGTSWGLGKLVFLEKEKQLCEHECRKEVLFPSANPQGLTVTQSEELL